VDRATRALSWSDWPDLTCPRLAGFDLSPEALAAHRFVRLAFGLRVNPERGDAKADDHEPGDCFHHSILHRIRAQMGERMIHVHLDALRARRTLLGMAPTSK